MGLFGFGKKSEEKAEKSSRELAERIRQLSGMVSGLKSGAESQNGFLKDEMETLQAKLSREESAIAELMSKLDGQMNAVANLKSKLEDQETAVQDLTDTMEDWRDEQNRHQNRLTRIMDGMSEERLAALGKENQSLLELAISSMEQIYSIRQAAEASGDESWKRQAELSMEKIMPAMRASDLQIIDETGIPVDFQVHETLSVTPTGDERLASRVESVIRPGYAYRGKVMKKAQITAYRFVREETE